MAADGRQAVLDEGGMALFDCSRPFASLRTREDGTSHDLVLVDVPRRHLPVGEDDVRHLTAVDLRERGGPAGLVSEFLGRLARDLPRYSESDALRLGTTVVDLTAAVLAGAAGSGSDGGSRRVLVERAQAYVLRHLTDPDLSAVTVAAGLHVSPRTLQAAFHDDALTVSAWIRSRRLDRCRRDLRDPGLAHLPTHTVGARWGFPSAAHFCRVFEAAYGTSPHAFRRAGHRC